MHEPPAGSPSAKIAFTFAAGLYLQAEALAGLLLITTSHHESNWRRRRRGRADKFSRRTGSILRLNRKVHALAVPRAIELRLGRPRDEKM
jgi:hypothetical protein